MTFIFAKISWHVQGLSFIHFFNAFCLTTKINYKLLRIFSTEILPPTENCWGVQTAPLNVLTACRNLSSALKKEAALCSDFWIELSCSIFPFSQQQRIECVCMRIYFSMLYAEIFSFSSPSSETKDGIWWWSIAKREKITSRSKAIASFPALFQVVLESKNKSDALKNIISHILMERKYFFQSHVVVVAFQMF